MTKLNTICSANDSLLLIIDIQAKLLSAIPEQDAALMLANSGTLITAAEILDIPIFLTEQYPKGLGRTDPLILEKLPETTRSFEKTGFSCCAAENFCQTLTKNASKQIILVGQETHVCVLQTAIELLNLGYQVYVVEDAVCSRKPSHKNNALQRLQHQGVIISNYESVLFEWLKDANHPQFKTISKLIH